MNTFLATLIVLALVGGLAWLVRRGPLEQRLATREEIVEVVVAAHAGSSIAASAALSLPTA